jgi:hypothetical protein
MNDIATEPKAMKSIKASAPIRKTRRMDMNVKPGTKNVLTVDSNLLDTKRFVYRFVNEIDNKVTRREESDWDVAHIPVGASVGDLKAGESQPDGTVIRKNVGNGTTAILMCKRKEWHEEDQKRKETGLMEIEHRMEDDIKKTKKTLNGD